MRESFCGAPEWTTISVVDCHGQDGFTGYDGSGTLTLLVCKCVAYCFTDAMRGDCNVLAGDVILDVES